MARHFNGSSDYVFFEAGNALGMTYGSIVAVVKIGVLQWNMVWGSLTATGGGGGVGANVVGFEFSDTGEFYYIADTSSDSHVAGGPTVADGWCLVAATKPAGSNVAQFYKYVFKTGTWTTPVGGTSAGDAAGTAAQQVIGEWEGYADQLNGDLAAVGVWKNRVLTDGEIRRLVRGRWAEMDPSILMEFPSGLDFPTQPVRDLARAGGRQTSISGTTRGTAEPPGFRFSILNRRR